MIERIYDVLIVGELNVDLILKGDVTPEFGQVEKVVDDLALCGGSSSAIFAVSAAKMGLRVLFSSRVGDDPFGRFMVEELQRNGLDARYITVDPEVRTGATVILSRGQDRAMLTYPGSMADMDARDVDAVWFEQARHLHVASPFLLTKLRPDLPRMMARAHAQGMTVSLDTNWDPSEEWAVDDLLEHTDILLPNEAELLAISEEREMEAALERLLPRVPVIAVKRGAAGALVATRDERITAPAYPVEVHDTTGAGDSFDGGFLAGWLRGEPLGTCARLGSICGSLTTAVAGGLNGQPTWAEAVRLLPEMG